jgi:catechol 2,3-dioxygenase-like lactoylglutathione lyase family enzyme
MTPGRQGHLVSRDEVVFNHVGHCVADLGRARRFYEDVLGFSFWWQFDVPDEQAAGVLRLKPPLGLSAVYLIKGGLVLELLGYSAPGVTAPFGIRTMNEPGLTHLSLSVADLEGTLQRVTAYGGEVLDDTRAPTVVFIRDPDGQLVELSTMDWLDQLPPRPVNQ